MIGTARSAPLARVRPVRDPGLAWPAPWRRQDAGRLLDRAPTLPASQAFDPSVYAAASASDRPHPLADARASAALRRRAQEIDSAFGAIEPLLRRLATQQFEAGFAERAAAELSALGLDLPAAELAADWNAPLDMRRLHARCVLRAFARLLAREFDRSHAALSEGEDAQELIRRWGFHAIDITACADGRLAGLTDFVLRVPPAVVAYRKSYAGGMFDVEETLRHWETVELARWREGRPNAASEPTRYLKLGVYHFSSADPLHEGCAAHGSDDARAAGALLERLEQFAQAVERTHCCGARVALLMVGVDTDTDAIRVHIPDAAGRMAVARYVDNRELFVATGTQSREAAKETIRAAVARAAGVAVDDAATEGMRWLCAYLLKNNIAQLDAVRAWHGGRYPDGGHDERLIIAGDAIDGVQLRNLAFQAQMDSIEEGAADLDVGVRILGRAHRARGVAVPVLVHCGFDERIPGAEERAARRARRMHAAMCARYAAQIAAGELLVETAVRPAGAACLQFIAADAEQERGA